MEKVVVANMKMNMTAAEINSFLEVTKEKINTKNVIICPSYLYIPYFVRKRFSAGVQDVHFEEEGAFTGSVSPKQVNSMGVKYTIVGHSERRQIFKDTDSVVNKKVISALNNELNAIICIGETAEERALLKTDKVLKRQIVNALLNVPANQIKNIMIAYEPVWSIGTGVVPTSKEINITAIYIKGIINKLYPETNVKVLYGGSVNVKNIESINKISAISGVLVGGACLNPNSLIKIKEVVLG